MQVNLIWYLYYLEECRKMIEPEMQVEIFLIKF